MRILILILTVIFGWITTNDVQQSEPVYDLVIYGATSAGVAAAIQAKRMNQQVILLSNTDRVGGLTTGGLGQTDIGNKAAIGGISREFYKRINTYYQEDQNWKWQKKSAYKDGGQTQTEAGEEAMWTFEPSAALQIYEGWMKEEGVQVVKGELLDRKSGVEMEGNRIVSITMLNGHQYVGRHFMDATYEGDLMAAAGVSYTVGRESNSEYNETMNGVHTQLRAKTRTGHHAANAINHNFVDGVDPYKVKGDPSSGLLPFINPDGPGEEGQGDHHVQAYCYRMCLTDHPDNRIPFEKPDNYNELDYELLLRNYEAGEDGFPWINSAMPNRKTDTNNRTGFSTDFIGQNYDYPEASYAERQVIADRHRDYQKGLMWTLANHSRIPEKIRSEVARWGTCKDEFAREDGWQEQLYVREARRMKGVLVMTQAHCEGLEVVEDVIGLAAYGMDSHNTQRYVNEQGYVKNEGNVEAHVASPYAISYRAILPEREECVNLLVPVCLSASHIAFGSIRMEPVFMVLGQSAATAAALAQEAGQVLHDLPYDALRAKLLQDKQRLVWQGD